MLLDEDATLQYGDDDDNDDDNDDDDNYDNDEDDVSENEEIDEKQKDEGTSTTNEREQENHDSFQENMKGVESNPCPKNVQAKVPISSSSSSSPTPIKILEIGCGDVPLAPDLYHDLIQENTSTTRTQKENTNEMDNVNNQSPLVVEQIIAFDYSQPVIDLLIKRQKEEQQEHNVSTCDFDMNETVQSKVSQEQHVNTISNVEYKVHDARDLPYSNSSFNVIVDKGTLDAMLSDEEHGKINCIQIVSEASRLLAMDGTFSLSNWRTIVLFVSTPFCIPITRTRTYHPNPCLDYRLLIKRIFYDCLSFECKLPKGNAMGG